VNDRAGNSGETGFNLGHLLGQTNLHLVAVFNPAPARRFLGLYTNGVLAASTSTGAKHIASIVDVFSLLGRSLWSTDPGLNGSIDEFRIYDGALSTNQIAATQALGPHEVLSISSPNLNFSVADSDLTLSWPLPAAGFGLVTRTNLSLGDWVPVTSPAPQIVGDHWQITVPISGDTQFFRLVQ